MDFAKVISTVAAFLEENDPTRILAELEDIRFLLTLPDIDQDEIRGYFEKYELGDLHAEIERSS